MEKLKVEQFPHIGGGYSENGSYLTIHEKYLRAILQVQQDCLDLVEKLQPQIDGYWKIIRQCQEQEKAPPIGIEHLVHSLEGEQRAYAMILHRLNDAISGRGVSLTR